MKGLKILIVMMVLLGLLTACGKKAEVKGQQKAKTTVETTKAPADTTQPAPAPAPEAKPAPKTTD